MPISLRRTLSASLFSAVLIAIAAVPASASSLAASCDGQQSGQPFLPWADPAFYTLAPDGAIEQGASSWSLAGGAAPVAGNEPYYVHASGDRKSLGLPAGSSAASDSMCVGLEHPTVRFFAKRTGGSAFGSLRVDVLYTSLSGEPRSMTIGSVSSASTSWTLTPQMVIGANLMAPLDGGSTAIALRFVAHGASWAIDDVYVDPWRRN